MDKSDVKRGLDGAAPAQGQAPNSKHAQAESATAKPASHSGADQRSDHVCTDACTHEGATKGKATTTSSAPGPMKVTPPAAKGSNESAGRRT